MQIERVEAFHVEWDRGVDWIRRSAWVRVFTEDGTYGLGEISPMASGNASLEIVRSSFAPMLTGKDPLDSTVLHHRLFHQHIKLGPEGAFAAALAAVDIALWDLKGKLLGQPIYKLLGGAWKTALPFYASVGGNAERTPDEVCRAVERWLPLAPALVKIRFDGDKTVRDAEIPQDIEKAKAVRQLVGDNFPLAFDANNRYSVSGAIRVGRALEDLGYQWFEEPTQHYHTESLGKVAQALDIAVSAGEQEYTLQGIKRLLDAGIDIVQPDIVKCGGFTGLREMAALTRAYGADLVPHQTQPTVGTCANVHFVASLLHSHHPCEYASLPDTQEVVFERFLKPQNGLFTLPDTPGLGLTLHEEELQKRLRFWRE
ncbi:MAG: mandelate racemase/muconate lactonizing enzyme family protein [Armatimonadaceae bacterium]